MHLLTTVHALHAFRQSRIGTTVGLVPTMGALHTGHIALVEAARQACDVVIATVFVNPIQFNNPDDLARYPRTLDADAALLEAAGCDALFAPAADELYAEPPMMRLNFGELETVMEGAFRPGHFNGVGIVVAKLFNLTQPDRAYFGQKDLQQVAVIRRLIRDLSFPIELVRFPTVRETDGLAMSSRNRNLTADERALAPAIFESLTLARNMLAGGQTVAQAKASVAEFFSTRPGFRLEYVEVANADTLRPVPTVQAPGQTAICIAAHLGKVRLIDNLLM